MEVELYENPATDGFVCRFDYDPRLVDAIRNCLGFTWDKKARVWTSEGPEVLLDMQRFGIGISHLSSGARRIAEEFRQNLWDLLEVRAESFDNELWGYQRQGKEFLALQKAGILADDMGTGKSKQSLDAAVEVEPQHVLIVCEKTPTYNWLNECQTWYPELSSAIVPYDTYKRKEFFENLPTFTIVNYEKLLTKYWDPLIPWDVVIFDEAQRIKNQATQTWRVVRRIVKNSKRAWFLTGTPLEKKVEDLYNLMSILRPSVFGSFSRFKNHHISVNMWGKEFVKNPELLMDRIGPWMLRRTKEEVLPLLPPKLPPRLIYIDRSPAEEASYKLLRKDFEEWLDQKGMGASSAEAMVQTMRMRQFTCSPEIFKDPAGRGSKYEELVLLLKENPDHKFVIFVSFEEMASLMRDWLQKDVGYNPAAFISGNIGAQDRFKAINAFNNDQLGQVFLSTDAGRAGINLTAAEAVIHYDQIYNAQKMNQREDRLHRIGQKNPVLPVHLLVRKSIDVGMYQDNLEEAALFNRLIEGTEAAVARKYNPERWKKLIAGEL